MPPRLTVPTESIKAFCQRWRIVELAFFGSILRDDFGPDSDVDILVSFSPDARWSLLDLADMQEELAALFGRKVDLIEQEALRNPFRRRSMVSSKEVLYAA